MDYVYRLRSIDALVSKFHELEQEEIYLSSPERLNDPMEGYKDAFWDGDETLWENLLGHYLLCLNWATVYCLLSHDETFEAPEIPAELSEEKLSSGAARAAYQEAKRRFFTDASMRSIPRALASLGTPLRAHGLRLVLSGLHTAACKAVFDVLKQENVISPGQLTEIPQATMAAEMLQKLSAEVGTPEERADLVEGLGFAVAQMSEAQAIRFVKTAPAGVKSGSLKKNMFFLMEFPHRYVQAISDRLTHMKWHTACFSATCVNASMWSVYADEHRGAALMFKPKPDADGAPTLSFNMVSGMSYAPSVPKGQPVMNKVDMKLHQVRYTLKAPEIDFFQSLGTLTHHQLQQQWYTNQAGVVSPRLKQFQSNVEEWRKGYWQSMIDVATTKLEDWRHEEEYRIVVVDTLGLRRDHPKAKFDFEQLAGIVFGMKTSLADRLAIVDIVQKKCEALQRKDFVFKHVAYVPKKGQLVVV